MVVSMHGRGMDRRKDLGIPKNASTDPERMKARFLDPNKLRDKIWAGRVPLCERCGMTAGTFENNYFGVCGKVPPRGLDSQVFTRSMQPVHAMHISQLLSGQIGADCSRGNMGTWENQK
eukprot:662975-Pelagomonas_calceolata.AAC.3